MIQISTITYSMKWLLGISVDYMDLWLVRYSLLLYWWNLGLGPNNKKERRKDDFGLENS